MRRFALALIPFLLAFSSYVASVAVKLPKDCKGQDHSTIRIGIAAKGMKSIAQSLLPVVSKQLNNMELPEVEGRNLGFDWKVVNSTVNTVYIDEKEVHITFLSDRMIDGLHSVHANASVGYKWTRGNKKGHGAGWVYVNNTSALISVLPVTNTCTYTKKPPVTVGGCFVRVRDFDIVWTEHSTALDETITALVKNMRTTLLNAFQDQIHESVVDTINTLATEAWQATPLTNNIGPFNLTLGLVSPVEFRSPKPTIPPSTWDTGDDSDSDDSDNSDDNSDSDNGNTDDDDSDNSDSDNSDDNSDNSDDNSDNSDVNPFWPWRRLRGSMVRGRVRGVRGVGDGGKNDTDTYPRMALYFGADFTSATNGSRLVPEQTAGDLKPFSDETCVLAEQKVVAQEKMLLLSIDQKFFNDFLLAAHVSGFLNFDIDRETVTKLPTGISMTTRDFFPIMPKFFTAFPNHPVRFHFSTSEAPRISIGDGNSVSPGDSFSSVSVKMHITVDVMDNLKGDGVVSGDGNGGGNFEKPMYGVWVEAFTLEFEGDFSFRFSMTDTGAAAGEVAFKKAQLNLVSVHPKIGDKHADKTAKVWTKILEKILLPIVVPIVNRKLQKGVALPLPPVVSLKNFSIFSGKGCYVLGTDLTVDAEQILKMVADNWFTETSKSGDGNFGLSIFERETGGDVRAQVETRNGGVAEIVM
eukprot:GDKI01019520.1.p1 GENE.GDKI01019520.1~~GDKI01019520.1.p1  ORF type:complete len:692 (+),score=228.39 GDKI01019520.1:138-2213(+)